MALRRRVSLTAKRALLLGASRLPVRPGLRVLAYHEFPPVQEFERHLDVLTTEGSVISETELLSAIGGERPWPTDRLEILITADDGYACQFSDHYNELFATRGVSPIIFLIGCALFPDELAKHPRLSHDEAGRPRPLVDREALREGLAAGWTLGAHTWSHPDPAALKDTELEDEISGAADRVEQSLQTQIRTFAWPWGKAHNTSRSALDVVESRFRAAFSTRAGRTSQPPAATHFINRDAVDQAMSAEDLRGLLAGGLDLVRSRRDHTTRTRAR